MQHSSTAVSLGTNSALTVFGVLTLNDWAAIAGIVCGLATLAVNFYYKRKADRRQQRRSSDQ